MKLSEQLEVYMADNLQIHTLDTLMQTKQFKQRKRYMLRMALARLQNDGYVLSVVDFSNKRPWNRRLYAHVGITVRR